VQFLPREVHILPLAYKFQTWLFGLRSVQLGGIEKIGFRNYFRFMLQVWRRGGVDGTTLTGMKNTEILARPEET